MDKIYNTDALRNRTFIEQVIALYNMGSDLEDLLYVELNKKQDRLVSGRNIKTINNKNILGHGNLDVTADIIIDQEIIEDSPNPVANSVIYNALLEKQDVLISGENIKTILGNDLLGGGNIDLEDMGLGDIDATNVEIQES